MARIQTYQSDQAISSNDLWIGTDGDNSNRTKNFSPVNLAKYFNSSEGVNKTNAITFKYQTLDPGESREPGTISFSNSNPATINFSAITSIMVSKRSLGLNYVDGYLSNLQDTTIIIHKGDTVNKYGVYLVSSIEENALDPNFFDLNMTFIQGNSGLEEDKEYILSVVDFSQGTSVTPDATSIIKGKIRLAGDLGGTADAPTVPGLANKENTIAAGTTSQYWRGDKTWQTLDKSAVGLGNVDNTSDANKPVSTAVQTALNAKEDKSNKSTATGLGTSDDLYPTQNAVKTYVDTQVASTTIPDATATTKGKIKLAGDLGGTADAPTVPALANKVDKVIGKGLSTNDYTTTEKDKLAGIASGAEVNVNADWNATSGDAQILNKPSIPSISGLATESYVDSKVEDTIVDGITTKAPSQNAVFDALDLKKSKKIITILAVGQSNMCGHFTGGGDYSTNANVKVWNGSAWVIADLMQEPFLEQDLFNTKPNNNLAFHFAKQLQEDTDNEIRIITSFHTGQPIEYWNTGGAAWTALTGKISSSSTSKIDIILFMQGEANKNETASSYAEKFNTFLTNIRNLSEVADNVPFVCGELKEGTIYSVQNAFFDNIRSYVTDNFVVTAKTKELPVDGGVNDTFAIHYSGASLVKMGRERFYNAFLNSNKNATDNTLDRLVVNTATPENGFNVINGDLSIGNNNTRLYAGSYSSSPTESYLQSRNTTNNQSLRLLATKFIFENKIVDNSQTFIGINNLNPTANLDIVGDLALSTSLNSGWAVGVNNLGTTNAHGMYVNIGASSTGLPFAVYKNFSSLFQVSNNGNVGIGTTHPKSKLHIVGLPEYLDNATAIAGGLTVGAFYHTAGVLKVVI
jgi:hypothetical protein